MSEIKEVGRRVGALSQIKDGTMELFGYGVLEGDKVPDDNSVKFGGTSLKEINLKNPCILLDNGDRVYGCECWWGDEERIKAMAAKCHTVVIVSIIEQRKG